MSHKPDKAFILAAGMGTRLRPYTDKVPKPMVAINGKSLIHRSIEKLKAQGVTKIVINLHYLGDILKEHLKGITDVDIVLSEEKELLGTGGGVKNALHHFHDEPFYCINGDALWDDSDHESALERLGRFWNEAMMNHALLLEPKNLMISGFVGDYDLDNAHKIERNIEKQGNYMFAGIQILSPDVFKDTPDNAFSLLSLMDQSQNQNRLFGLVHNAPWYHISTPKDLEDVDALFKRRSL